MIMSLITSILSIIPALPSRRKARAATHLSGQPTTTLKTVPRSQIDKGRSSAYTRLLP
jgi:hypothetical protein